MNDNMEESTDEIVRRLMREHKQARKQVILLYDKQLYSLNEQLDEIEKRLKRTKKLDLDLIKSQTKLINEVIRVSRKKFEVEMQPTLDPKLNKIITEAWREKNSHIDEDDHKFPSDGKFF